MKNNHLNTCLDMLVLKHELHVIILDLRCSLEVLLTKVTFSLLSKMHFLFALR